MTSAELIQTLIVAAGGIGLLLLVLRLSHRGHLSLRFGFSWMIVAISVVVVAGLLSVIEPAARRIDITPTGLLLGLSSLFLLFVSLHLSVTVSRLQESVRDLSEAHALLEIRVDQAKSNSKNQSSVDDKTEDTSPTSL